MSALVRRAVREMAAYVPGEQPRDPSVVKLNTNENPYPPSPAVAEALRRVAAADLRLYPDPSCARLRERIAALHGCAPERVFVGNGSDEILALCTRAFGEPGGAIGWFDPSYSLYPVLARIVGAAARPVALGPAFGWANPGPDAGGLFFLATPNAPTGIRYARADVAAFCDAARGVVVLDEAYVDFASDHFADLALAGDRALSLRTLSKSWSLAGLRLGYALGPAELVAALEKVKDSYNVDRLAQELACAALGDPGHMRANVARVVATRERTAAALRARGFEVLPSEANFLFARPPRIAAREVFERLRARGIYVRWFDGPRTAPYLRISIGADAQMDRLLEALDAVLPPPA